MKVIVATNSTKGGIGGRPGVGKTNMKTIKEIINIKGGVYFPQGIPANK